MSLARQPAILNLLQGRSVKLSQAIKAGALLAYSICGQPSNGQEGSCALEAAMVAVGLSFNPSDSHSSVPNIVRLFPSLHVHLTQTEAQEIGTDIVTRQNAIEFWNDRAYLTCEQIACEIIARGWDCEQDQWWTLLFSAFGVLKASESEPISPINSDVLTVEPEGPTAC